MRTLHPNACNNPQPLQVYLDNRKSHAERALEKPVCCAELLLVGASRGSEQREGVGMFGLLLVGTGASEGGGGGGWLPVC